MSDPVLMTVPAGVRTAARVLVLSEQDRLLLLEAEDAPGRHRWWVAPGGGLQAGETFEAAAERELYEETGLRLAVVPWVWTRRHVFTWKGRRHDQYEHYFVVRTTESPLAPTKADSYVIGHRWWTLSELERSDEECAPRRLAGLIAPIIHGAYPKSRSTAASDCSRLSLRLSVAGTSAACPSGFTSVNTRAIAPLRITKVVRLMPSLPFFLGPQTPNFEATWWPRSESSGKFSPYLSRKA
jgi:8-oxo-dGTP pyrophosphatase MutT (NUDIX family)